MAEPEFTEGTRLFVTMGLAGPVELVAKRLCLGLSLPAWDAELRVSEPCEQCREHALELVELLLPWLRAEIVAARPIENGSRTSRSERGEHSPALEALIAAYTADGVWLAHEFGDNPVVDRERDAIVRAARAGALSKDEFAEIAVNSAASVIGPLTGQQRVELLHAVLRALNGAGG